MEFFGDIKLINGAEIPVVDCIIGGSPCQDLSVAGKRAGLAGERSGLFKEQIRVVREMREHDRASGRTGASIRPRFMVWENVAGAFSSNKSEDFRAVLEETAKIIDETSVIPRPPKGKWTPSGCIMGDGWSIAWRVFDAQFWGVPQRRRRIALVADFGGKCAPEILFERESMSGNTEESGEEGKETSENLEGSFKTTKCWPINTMIATRWNELGERTGLGIGEEGSPQYTLSTAHEHAVCFTYENEDSTPVIAFSQNQRNEVRDLHDVAGALAAQPGVKQQTYVCVLCKETPLAFHLTQDPISSVERTPCLSSGNSATGQATIGVLAFKGGQGSKARSLGIQEEVSPTLIGCQGGNRTPNVCIPINDKATRYKGGGSTRNGDGSGNGLGVGDDGDPMYTLTTADRHVVAVQQNASGECRLNDVANTLSTSGNASSRNAPLIAETTKNVCLYPSVSGTICASGAGTNRPAGQGNETDLCIVQAIDCRNNCVSDNISGTLQSKSSGGYSLNYINPILCLNCPKTGEKCRKNSSGIKNLTPGETQTDRIYDPSGVFPALCSGGEKSGMNRQAVICMAHSMPHAEICEDMAPTLTCHHEQPFVHCKTIVRRLTPVECERLQGYPDKWTDLGVWTDEKGKPHKTSDSARYKALGNSIALPSWKWVLNRLCSCYNYKPTLGSLFDGISGFCLIWKELNGLKTIKWTSEIDNFPIAVCKRHFG